MKAGTLIFEYFIFILNILMACTDFCSQFDFETMFGDNTYDLNKSLVETGLIPNPIDDVNITNIDNIGKREMSYGLDRSIEASMSSNHIGNLNVNEGLSDPSGKPIKLQKLKKKAIKMFKIYKIKYKKKSERKTRKRRDPRKGQNSSCYSTNVIGRTEQKIYETGKS